MALAAIAVIGTISPAQAQDPGTAVWQVGKSSGEVWVTTSGVQPASLTDQAIFKAGDSIRTGRNGRVLLVRGEETILIAPNSVVALPATQTDRSSTTIVQQAGSILVDVERRNVKHFEVETPYLVVAVKGTQFRVSVDRGDASVSVVRGEVEVADFRSGQHALVLPGQTAKVSTQGRPGLSLSGAGTFNPIRQGEPRRPSVQRVPVPRGGLSAPRSGPDGRGVRALDVGADRAHVQGGNGAMRIAVPLGDVRLDIHKVTGGLARDAAGSASGGGARQTVWSSGDILPGNGVGKTYNQGNNGSATGNGSANGNGSGNGNAGGNGNGVGSSNAGGNGNAYGLTGGNGNGNSNGSANGSSGGNGNAGGNGNGSANGAGSNAGGNGNGNAYGLTGGNGNGNSNAGGNGRGRGRS
jgi:hypothetical protein